jgi:hypothetical protein
VYPNERPGVERPPLALPGLHRRPLEAAAAELRHASLHHGHQQVRDSGDARPQAEIGDLLAFAEDLLQLSLETIEEL